MSNQWFDWEDSDEKDTDWQNHGSPFHETIGNPFGDNFLDWDDLEKQED